MPKRPQQRLVLLLELAEIKKKINGLVLPRQIFLCAARASARAERTVRCDLSFVLSCSPLRAE